MLVLSILIACENSNSVSTPVQLDKAVSQQKRDTNLDTSVKDDKSADYYKEGSGGGFNSWQKPDEVIKFLGDLDGESVADIGAGTGYFAFRLALKADKVIALDIDPNMIQLMNAINDASPERIQYKFETRLAKENDANLEEDEVDNIIIINTIAFIENRKKYLQDLKKGLKKGGKLMIVDFKMKRLAIDGPAMSNRVPHYKIENLMQDAGYSIIESDDMTLEYQYIVVGQYD